MAVFGRSVMHVVAVLAMLAVPAIHSGCSAEGDKAETAIENMGNTLARAEKAFEAGDAGGGAVLLLDAVSEMKPVTAWPDGFMSAIDEARARFVENNLSDAVASVGDALALVQLGKKERKKESGGRVGAVAAVLKKNLTAVRANLERGNTDRAVVFILEGLLLLAPSSVSD